MSLPRLPTVLYWAVWGAIVGLPAVLMVALATGMIGREALIAGVPAAQTATEISGGQIMAALLVGLLPWVIVMVMLFRTQALLDLYRRDQALSREAARHIHAIGLGLAALGAAKAAVHTAQALIVTSANPPGERVLSIAIGSAEVGFLLAGGLMITIGRSMAEAARAADDLRGFV